MSAGCFSLVAGMAPAEQNGGDFIGNGTFVFIDNSEKYYGHYISLSLF